jgi:hypothetical protein
MRYIIISLFFLITSTSFAGTEHKPSDKEQAQLNHKGNGICFTPNKGQIANMDGKLVPDVLYKADGSAGNVFLRKTGISYVFSNMGEVMHELHEQEEEKEKELKKTGNLKPHAIDIWKEEAMRKSKINFQRVDMDFANCNTNITTSNENEIEGFLNFYYAHCPDGVTNVKQFHKVRVNNIYNGIDISYYGSAAEKNVGLKYDIIVQPHADPNQIKLHWTGADNIQLNGKGNLQITTRVNEFEESMPEVYQLIDGKTIIINAKYELEKIPSPTSNLNTHYQVTFKLSNYNSNYPLIIDPWATYYGGAYNESGTSVATDAAGDVYMAGWTFSSTGIASATGFQTVYGGAGA